MIGASSLWGNRPTLVACEEGDPDKLSDKYYVRTDKAELAVKTGRNEQRLLELVKPEDSNEENERYLILTMPEVNKDRHDALIDSVNVLYDGCKAKMDKTSAEYRVKLEAKIVTLPTDDERNQAKVALEDSIKNHQDIIDTVKADKLKEIEEAYQRYLDEQAAKKAQEDEIEATRVNRSSNSMKMGSYEE